MNKDLRCLQLRSPERANLACIHRNVDGSGRGILSRDSPGQVPAKEAKTTPWSPAALPTPLQTSPSLSSSAGSLEAVSARLKRWEKDWGRQGGTHSKNEAGSQEATQAPNE